MIRLGRSLQWCRGTSGLVQACCGLTLEASTAVTAATCVRGGVSEAREVRHLNNTCNTLRSHHSAGHCGCRSAWELEILLQAIFQLHLSSCESSGRAFTRRRDGVITGFHMLVLLQACCGAAVHLNFRCRGFAAEAAPAQPAGMCARPKPAVLSWHVSACVFGVEGVHRVATQPVRLQSLPYCLNMLALGVWTKSACLAVQRRLGNRRLVCLSQHRRTLGCSANSLRAQNTDIRCCPQVLHRIPRELLVHCRSLDGRIAPHGGGPLADLMVRDPHEAQELVRSCRGRVLECSDRNACDIELLLGGGFSPLQGFMGRHAYESVTKHKR